MLVTACPNFCRLIEEVGLSEHVGVLQVMFDATMLLAQEYRAMLARAKQRSAEKLTEQLRKVRTPFSLFPQGCERALPWVGSQRVMPDVIVTLVRQA